MQSNINSTPRGSIRKFMITIILAAFTVFVIVFFAIFLNNMTIMLEQAESDHMTESSLLLHGSLEATLKNAYSNTRTWSSWDEVYTYVQGDNPEFTANNLDDGSMILLYKMDFALIKDVNGNDIYLNSRPVAEDETLIFPEGLSERISIVSENVIKGFERGAELYGIDEGPYGDSGFVVVDGKSYLISVMPILTNAEEGPPVGTFTFISIFGNDSLRELTSLNDYAFEIKEPSNVISNAEAYEARDGEVTKSVALNSIGSKRPYILQFRHHRTLFNNGMSLISYTIGLLLFAVFSILLVLFFIVDKVLLKKLSALIVDVKSINQDKYIDTDKYDDTTEFLTLSTTINDMFERLDQSYKDVEKSKVSMSVMENILNGLDAYLYVSDSETDEILFINDNMRELFGIKEDPIGQKCWKVLQDNFTERCSFCPCHKFKINPDEEVVWEEHNTVTKRFYKNTDILIDWLDKKAHLQHSVDITDIKLAERKLQKRLDEQAAMSAISQSFISAEDIDLLIDNALEIAGNHLNARRISIITYNAEDKSIAFSNEWLNPETALKEVSLKDKRMKLTNAENKLMEALEMQRVHYIELKNIDFEEDSQISHFKNINPITLPLIVSGKLEGLVLMSKPYDEANKSVWTEDEISFGKYISSVLSGVLSRQEMSRQVRTLSSIVEYSPQYISSFARGELLYVNPAAEIITGYTSDELLKMGTDVLYDDETNRRLSDEILPAVLEKGRSFFELELIRKDNERRIIAFSAFVINKKTEHMGAIANDITKLRQLENDLINAKELAEQSSMAKGEFLSRMSHEMRTPMNAIIGMTNIARSSEDIKKKEYCLDKIDNASKHLLGVINDILDMSKIEANKFELSFSEFNFDRMLINVINVINFKIDEKSQRLTVSIDPFMPASIISDEQHLVQVLMNILSNAVKFTPENGKIDLGVKVLKHEEDRLQLQINVKDSGIGISAEQLPKLFRSFEQADGGIARKFGGTGLGLAISKRIVELMGGKIWIESEPGKGSNFIFTINALQGSDQSFSSIKKSLSKTKLNVLAVDDSEDVCEYFIQIMKELEIPCTVARNGFEAIKAVEEASKPFDIIFVDWKMPKMDGIELARTLRGRSDMHSVIIMVSSAEWNEIEKEAVAVGVDGFLPKPLFATAIMDCIERRLSGVSPENDISDKEIEKSVFPGKTMLLAEDVFINREIVLTILEDSMMEIECAENGLEAVQMFSEYPSKYDVIIMDMHMPTMDGLEATRQIRALAVPEAETVPIVAMTANVFKEDIEKCIEAGMNDHIGKPVDFDELCIKLSKYLNK